MTRADEQRNKITAPPYEPDILVALKSWGVFCPTFIVRNILRPKFPGLQTSQVLYRLKKMEQQGIVRRMERRRWFIDWQATDTETTK